MAQPPGQSHGLSFQQLAEHAWTTSSYDFRLCRGDARPGYTIVIRLALAMALTLEETDELLQLAGYPPLLETKAPANGIRPGQPPPATEHE